MRKFLIALLVFAGLAAGGYFGVDAYAQREAERQVETAFDNLKAQGLEARHGAVAFDLLGRRLDIADIVLAAPDGGGTTTIAAVTASGLNPPSGGRVKVGRIEATNVVFEGPSPLAADIRARYRMPRIVVEDYEGPERIAADGPEPWQLLLGFLEAASARSVALDSSVVETSLTSPAGGEAGADTTVTYGAARLEEIAAGKIARISVEPSTFAVKAPEGPGDGSASGSLGRIDAKGLDIAAMLALLDPARRAAGTEFRTLYEGIEVDGYSADLADGARHQWGKVSVGRVAVKPAGLPLEELVGLATRAQALQAKGERLPPQDAARLLDGIAAVYDAIQLGGMTLTDFTQEQPGLGTVTLKALQLGEMKDGRLARFTLEGFAGADAEGRPVKLDRLVIEGVRPGEAMTLGAAAVSDPASLKELPRQLAAFRIIEGIDLAGLVAPAGPLADDVINLDTLKLAWGDFVGPVPTRIAANLRISGPIDTLTEEEPFSLLAANGATRATVTFDAGLNWNEADKTYVLAPFALDIGDAFAASARVTLTGVDRASFLAAGQATDGLDALMAANVGPAEFTLTDNGLYTLKLKQVADDQGASPEAVQQLTLGIAQMLAQPVSEERPELASTIKAILDFLAQPKGTLNVKITPKGSLPLISVIEAANGNPVSLLNEVNAEATTTR